MILEKRYKYYNKNTDKIEKIGKKCSISNLKRTKIPNAFIEDYEKYKNTCYFTSVLNLINGWLETHEPHKKIIFKSKEFNKITTFSNGYIFLMIEPATKKGTYRLAPKSFSFSCIENFTHKHITRKYNVKGYCIIKADNDIELYKKIYDILESLSQLNIHVLGFNTEKYEQINLCEVENNEK